MGKEGGNFWEKEGSSKWGTGRWGAAKSCKEGRWVLENAKASSFSVQQDARGEARNDGKN